MSKVTAPSKVSIITVSAEQFNAGLDSIGANTAEAMACVMVCTQFIIEQVTYKDQQAAAKKLAKVYQKMMALINGKIILDKSAMQWVWGKCKTRNAAFKALKSQSPAAKKKAKARAAQLPAGDKAAPAKPAKAEATPISTYRLALIEKEVKIQNDFRGVIPEGKIKQFDQAFAAFIKTLELILV